MWSERIRRVTSVSLLLSSEYLNTDSVCACLQQLFQNGGHQQKNDVEILETKFWLKPHQINTQQDNVFAPKDLRIMLITLRNLLAVTVLPVTKGS